MRFNLISRVAVLVTLFASGCSSSETASSVVVDTTISTTSPGSQESLFPDVVNAVATKSDSGWTFDVTLSSPYDTPERYADAWRVIGPDGTEFGVRELDHDHASEQPFTRSLTDVQIPEDVENVVVEGRDQVSGYGGTTFEVALVRG